MKHEWKKDEKKIYIPGSKPFFLDVPKYRYFTINGKGNINDSDFAERIDILYRLSNAIKMMPKRGFIPGGYFEYSIYPVEAIWYSADGKDTDFDKENMTYTLMLRQPEFVTEAIARMTVTNIISTNPHPLINDVNFTSSEDGSSIQIMHTGTNESKVESFKKLIEFSAEKGYKIKNGIRREIYISNTKRTSPERFKTVLRLMVDD